MARLGKGRRRKRLLRVSRLRVKERRLEAAVRLGTEGLQGDLKEVRQKIGVLTRAMTKRPPSFDPASRHPLHEGPDGELNRALGNIRRSLDVAAHLYGGDCLDALEEARNALHYLIDRDSRAYKFLPLADETYGRLYWTHVKSAADRVRHFRERATARRQKARAKRRLLRPRTCRGFPSYMYRAPPRLRDVAALRNVCECWLCTNKKLFNAKNGKLR